jgi:hypothetical protein
MRRPHAVARKIVAGVGAWLALGVWAMAGSPAVVGRVQGLVRDAAGQALSDTSILAVGQSVVSVRSDATGRFALSLPPGEYVLKATRLGYVSTYRESLRVQSATLVERNITLVKQLDTPFDAPLDDAHAHTDLAWQLRHLARSVLRDGLAGPGAIGGSGRANGDAVSPLAGALLGPDVRGQVNFITTTTAQPLSDWASTAGLPRGIAHLSFGAPVTGFGAWQVRAAIASGEGAAWNVLGEYASDPAQDHQVRLRFSYSAQGYTSTLQQLTAAVAEPRSVAGIGGDDRWRLNSKVEVEYGARADRFDYLADPQLLSAHGGFNIQFAPRTFMNATVSRNMIAPGADEFLPPIDGGPWLPAEQMFFPLTGRGVLSAEDVRHAEVTLAHRLGQGERAPTIQVRRFWEQSVGQMATLFTVAGESTRGQYSVAQPGSVDLVGWSMGVGGQFSQYFSGRVEYARVTSTWDVARRQRALRTAAPSTLRDPREHVQDVTATLDANLPNVLTHVSLIYRASDGYSTREASIPIPGSRFDLQVRQPLPFRPSANSRVDLLFSIRNLFRDARGEASWYDELLTVGPPVRLMGGIQVRF